MKRSVRPAASVKNGCGSRAGIGLDNIGRFELNLGCLAMPVSPALNRDIHLVQEQAPGQDFGDHGQHEQAGDRLG